MTHPGHDGHRPVIEGTTVPPRGLAPQGREYDPFATGAPGGAHGGPTGGAVPHGAVQPWVPAQGAYGPTPVVVMPAEKSVGVAFVLTFFFGVLGMFYATVPGALILLGITLGAILLASIVIGLLSVLTLGFGAILFTLVPLIGIAAWITSIVWGASPPPDTTSACARSTHRPGSAHPGADQDLERSRRRGPAAL